MAHIQVHNVDLWVEQFGQGPDVAIIAGLAEDAELWEPVAAELSDSFRVTTFDNRGVGRSSTPSGNWRIADFAEDTAALLSALKISRAHIVGASMGGAIAQELVLRHPELVQSLMLHGTWCQADRHFRDVIRTWQILSHEASAREFFLGTNVWFYAPQIYNEHIDEWLEVEQKNPNPQTLKAFSRSIEAILDHDTKDRLPQIACPTLVSVGSLDIAVPERFSRQLVDGIPDAKLRILNGSGHMLYAEDPPTFAAVAREFISSCSG